MINGNFYIGYTKQKVSKRFSQHCKPGKMVINHAIQKYGIANFEVSLLHECDDKNEAIKKEILLIATLKPQYNVHIGGTGGPMYGPMNGMYGKEHTLDWKKNKSKSVSGQNNPMYGKNHTDETKRKISKSKSGTSPSNKGVPMSLEQRKKLSIPKTEEHKQKLRLKYEVDGVIVENAKQFCLDHNHNYIRFTQSARKNKPYKGMNIKIID